MKLCKDCEYYKVAEYRESGDCHHPCNIKINPLTGQSDFKSDAIVMRCHSNSSMPIKILDAIVYSNQCGPFAKWFKERNEKE